MSVGTTSRGRVLFVGHEASRTGAPMMLLHLLRWLRERTDVDFDLVLRTGGDLLEEYSRLARVFVMDESLARGRARAGVDRLRNLLRVPDLGSPRGLRSFLSRRRIGLVYSNTVTNAGALRWFSRFHCPVLCHVHEVPTFLDALDGWQLQQLRDRVTTYVAVAQATRATLVRLGIAPGRIVLVPGFVPVERFEPPDPERRRAFRRRHRIPDSAILVGGCGTPDWQKGQDVLVHVAGAIARHGAGRPVHFAWLGGNGTEPAFLHLMRDVERTGLTASFSVIPAIADSIDYFASLDLFALTSRDDPLPLVAMEAGALALPVVCFAGSGEPVDSESGVVVPYLDIEGFAAAIRSLADDDRSRAALGGRLAETIRARHDVSQGAPRIVEIIESLLETGSWGGAS